MAQPRPRVTTVLQTVTKPTGQTTTVIQQTTVQAPAPAPTTSASAPTTTASATPAGGSSGHSLNDQGYSRMQAGDYAGAVPLLQQAVQKLRGTGPSDPYEGYANYNLGYTLLKARPLRRGDSVPRASRQPRAAAAGAAAGARASRALRLTITRAVRRTGGS